MSKAGNPGAIQAHGCAALQTHTAQQTHAEGGAAPQTPDGKDLVLDVSGERLPSF